MKYQEKCTKTLTLRISDSDYSQLCENAKMWNVSVGAYVRRLITQDKHSKTLATQFIAMMKETLGDLNDGNK